MLTVHSLTLMVCKVNTRLHYHNISHAKESGACICTEQLWLSVLVGQKMGIKPKDKIEHSYS